MIIDYGLLEMEKTSLSARLLFASYFLLTALGNLSDFNNVVALAVSALFVNALLRLVPN